MTDHLRNAHGYTINRKRVRRLMRLMDIIALYPGPNLSKRYHAKYVRPYLLRNLNIDHIDHVWGVDITYLPLKKGFMYLFAMREYLNPDSPYIVIFCKVRKRDSQRFLDALAQLPNKMLLCGHLDYQSFCIELSKKMKSEIKTRREGA